MAFITPGVYIREIDLSQYAPALSTSILALVGVAKKGPVNKPTFITNELDLINTFGTPDPTSYMLYAAQQYLANGRQLIIVRVTDGNEDYSSLDIAGLEQPAMCISPVEITDGIDLSKRHFIRLDVDGTATDIDLLQNHTPPTGSPWAGTPITQVPLDQLVYAINLAFPGVASKDHLNSHLVLKTTGVGAGKYIEIQAFHNPSTDAARSALGADSVPLKVMGTGAASPALTITAKSPGIWADGYYVVVDGGTNTGTFKLTMYDNKGNLLESFDNLTKETVEQRVNPNSIWIDVDDNDNDTPPSPVVIGTPVATPEEYYLQGGADGITAMSDADYIGVIDPITGIATGLKSLQDIERLDVNLVAVPGISSGPVILAMLALCRFRADCMCIVDPPFGLSFQQVIEWHNGDGAWDGLHPAFNSSYGALYWPWVEMYDPYSEQRVWTPPSGWVASQMAFTDNVAYSWFAPAGLTRGRLETALNIEKDSDRGQIEFLYGNGNAVNPIVDFSRDGITIWGQRTLQRTPSALDRVNVRRMLLYAEKLVATVTKVLVFEPNDEYTWRRATNLINPILKSIKDSRGLEKFSVVIDESTNPPYLRNQNRMGGKLFLIPTKAAEVLVFDFILLPSGAEFSDIPT